MLTGFVNFHSEFRNLFGSSYTMSEDTRTCTYPVHYARKSKDNLTEKNREEYPQISLYDYAPELDPDWNDSYFTWVDGFRDTDNDNVIDKGYLYKEPLKFIMRYDVKVFTKNPIERWVIQSHFFKVFGQWGGFLFNKVEITTEQYDEELGDEVPYEISIREVERTDGVFEFNIAFVMKPFIAIREVQDVDLVTSLVLRLNQTETTISQVSATEATSVVTVLQDTAQYAEDFTNASTITVTHNLGREVAVVIIDSDGIEMEAEVDHVSLNIITVTFGSNQTGRILVI